MLGFVSGFAGIGARAGARAAIRRRPNVVYMSSKVPAEKELKDMTAKDWQGVLTEEQFRVLRLKGTEYPGTGEYNKFYPQEGTFDCVACGTPLYKASTKFDSGCGWPAFYDTVDDNVVEITDADGRRTEILCKNCGGHLGHVFKGEGFSTPTNERHCVNSVCLTYREDED